MQKAVLVLAASLVLAPASPGPEPAARHWPGFRGWQASGVADDRTLPVTWDVSTSRGIAWKIAIPGLAHSSPIVWGDRLFVTTAVSADPNPQFRPGFYTEGRPAQDDSPQSWRLYCIDARTGRILWERVAHEGVPRSKRHPKSSHASSTPVTDGRHVVAFFGSEGLYGYDLEGKLLWKQDLGVLDAGSIHYPERQWGVASSPVLYDNLVIVQCDLQKGSFLAAYEIATGRRMWLTPRDEIPGWATPGVARFGAGDQIVINAARFVRGYEPRSGRELWRLANTSQITAPTPIAGADLMYVTSGYQPQKPIYAIRAGARGDISLKDGATSNDGVAWSWPRGGSYISTPLLYRGHLYTTSANGVLGCYDAATGEQVYEQRIAGKGGAYSASAVAADGRLYLSSEDGELHVIRAGRDHELLATNTFGEPLMATPAIASGRLFVRTTRHLYAIGPATP
jgi:outer membrane protein assembly factor BamB